MDAVAGEVRRPSFSRPGSAWGADGVGHPRPLAIAVRLLTVWDVAALEAKHVRIRPYTPRTNGNAERFIQTMLRLWAYVGPYNSSDDRAAALSPWLIWYNRQRPHGSLQDHNPSRRSSSYDGTSWEITASCSSSASWPSPASGPYAHVYYRDNAEGVGGLSFPGDGLPRYLDFAYFAFTHRHVLPGL
jgi:hypothetical protein